MEKLREQMERELTEELEDDQGDRVLYHYTDAAGAIGIIKNGEVWATHFKHVNDPSEFAFGEDVLVTCLRELLDDPDVPEVEKALIDIVAQAYPDMKLSDIAEAFVISFSEERDSLSQWRCYGADGWGYSLGFSRMPERRDPVGNEEPLAGALLKVRYGEDNNRVRFKQHALRIAAGFAKYANTYGSADALWRDASAVALRQLALLVPAAKHEAYEHEAEWRLVVFPHDRKHTEMKFRSSPRGVTPYFEMQFQHGNRALVEVIAGPKHQTASATATRGLDLLLHNCVDPKPEILVSNLPYR